MKSGKRSGFVPPCTDASALNAAGSNAKSRLIVRCDCPYLQQAREHEKPRPADQIDPAGLFLQIEVSDQFMYEKEHLLMGLTYALAKSARADRSLNDQDLIAALSMLAHSYERRLNSGLHYEEPLTSESSGKVAAEVETMVRSTARPSRST